MRKAHIRLFVIALGLVLGLGFVQAVRAQDDNGFALQVSPSPLVTTLKPGQSSTLHVTIRNQGTQTEHLKIVPRSFQFNSKTQSLQLDDTTTPPFASWLSFDQNTFTIEAGQAMTEGVKISLPQDAGFSYSFALVISRVSDPTAAQGTRQLKGSLALFTLINVDRPGATRQLQLGTISTTRHIYEYLPATVNVELKNTGNSIVQPAGDVFIQRGAHDTSPISTVPINASNAYILPGTSRVVPVAWTDGFQVLQTVTAADGSTKQELAWNWSSLSHIRIGRYTAKVVAIYNDGQRDIPLEGEVSFWVIPWKLLLGCLVVAVLIGLGLWSIARNLFRLGGRVTRRRRF